MKPEFGILTANSCGTIRMQKPPFPFWIGRAITVGALLAPTLAFADSSAGNLPPRVEEAWLLLQYLFEGGTAFGWNRIGLYFLIVAGASLLLLWPMARLTLQRKVPFKACAAFLGWIILISAAALGSGYASTHLESTSVLAGIGIASLVAMFFVARRVFRTNAQTALIILLCFVSLTVVASHVAQQFTGAMPWTEFQATPIAEQRQVFADWVARKKAAETTPPAVTTIAAAQPPAPTVAPAPPKPPVQTPPPEPQTPAVPAPDLLALYTQLQKTRAQLDPNDPVAVARFNEQVAAYHQEKSFLAAVSAPPAPKAKPSSPERMDKAAKVPR